MAVSIGQKAPDFTLKNAANEDVSLSDFAGQKNVVLVFFPNAFSPVCTDQLTALDANAARYRADEAQVIGVSVDGRWSQAAFAESLGLTDTILLSDFEPKGATARAYGTYLDLGFSGRATFVIDKQGIVRGVELTDNPGQMPDEERYFDALAACSV
jgi:peroxiredoxin (alkyl hydroperoxide reductase subunit C)